MACLHPYSTLERLVLSTPGERDLLRDTAEMNRSLRQISECVIEMKAWLASYRPR
jgi:hypothetical protein